MSARQDELGALTRLAFGEVGRMVGGVAGMHRAIAERAFAVSGPGGSPAQVMHDGTGSAVYAGVRGGGSWRAGARAWRWPVRVAATRRRPHRAAPWWWAPSRA